MPAPAVLIHVQHLLGIGHLRRAAAIGRAIAAEGLAVTLVSGGPKVPLELGAAKLVQLEPVRAADAAFSGLVDIEGKPIDEAFKARRRAHLLGVFHEARPRVLITELYPFGRRQLRFELAPLIRAAHAMTPRPVLLASVRDILVDKGKMERVREMAQLARDFYDRVLVHGDATLVPFEASFPLAHEIADLIVYTGYVASGEAPAAAPPGIGEDEIVVSAGGGAVGARLIETALGAHDDGPARLHERTWRVLAGSSVAQTALDAWQRRARPGIIIERARADFPSLLGRAALSVSQAGYNTVMDVLAAGTRCVLVPFAAGLETEQTMRAEALARAGRARVVPEAGLTPARLAAAMLEALDAPTPGPSPWKLDGAREAARLVARLAKP
ncbi:MAG: glycosyltransferase family protein [Alphaproteobacteria bacterium]